MTNTEDVPPGPRRAPAGGAWLAAIMIVSWTAGSGTMEMEEGRWEPFFFLELLRLACRQLGEGDARRAAAAGEGEARCC